MWIFVYKGCVVHAHNVAIAGFTVPDDAPPADVIVRNCEICLKVKTTMWYRNRDYIVDKLRIQNVDHFESKSP